MMTSGARYSSVPTKELARPSGLATSITCWPLASTCAVTLAPLPPFPPLLLAPLAPSAPAAASTGSCGAGAAAPPPTAAPPLGESVGSTIKAGVVEPWQ